MTKKLFIICFGLILFLGILLRFYQLGTVPGSLEWDEVSIGYNAYAVLHTGKDEYGQFLPTAFRAFGEYKQPVYIYMDAVSIGLFGLNAFAVRLPAALFGSLTIVFVYLLTQDIFRKQKFVEQISLLSMLFFAISPWSIQFSRAAFEANVSLFIVIGGTWLFLKGLRLKRNWYFYIAILFFILSTYTYISAKLIVPFLLISLCIYGKSYFASKKKVVVILLIVFAILSSLWVLDTRSISRSQGVIFTNQKDELLATPIKEMQFDVKTQDKLGALMHNRRIVYAQTVFSNYVSHFNPLWLFVNGDAVTRHHAPGFGLLYFISLPFILLGMYFFLSRFFSSTWILFFWFLIAPLASTLTFEAPHALRSLLFLPTWQIFEAGGYIFVWQRLTTLLRKIFLVVFCFIFLCNFVYYLHQYFVHTNTDYQKDWQFGYKEAMLATNSVSANKRVIFSSNFEQPYIFYLFYKGYDSQKYIDQGSSWRTQSKCYTIDNAYFGNCKDKLRKGDVYVSVNGETLANTITKQSMQYADGGPAVTILEYK